MRLGEEVGGGIWNFVPIVRQGVFCAARRRRKSRLIFIFSICVTCQDVTCRQRSPRAIVMSALQAFFLGIMVAWTPALLFLAWVLRHAAFGDSREVQRRLRAGQETRTHLP